MPEQKAPLEGPTGSPAISHTYAYTCLSFRASVAASLNPLFRVQPGIEETPPSLPYTWPFKNSIVNFLYSPPCCSLPSRPLVISSPSPIKHHRLTLGTFALPITNNHVRINKNHSLYDTAHTQFLLSCQTPSPNISPLHPFPLLYLSCPAPSHAPFFLHHLGPIPNLTNPLL